MTTIREKPDEDDTPRIAYMPGFGPPPDVPASTVRGDDICCPHQNVILHEQEREVRCRRCEALIDPYDTLVHLSRNWDRWQALEKEWRARIAKIGQELDRLATDEANAKNRLRNTRDKIAELEGNPRVKKKRGPRRRRMSKMLGTLGAEGLTPTEEAT